MPRVTVKNYHFHLITPPLKYSAVSYRKSFVNDSFALWEFLKVISFAREPKTALLTRKILANTPVGTNGRWRETHRCSYVNFPKLNIRKFSGPCYGYFSYCSLTRPKLVRFKKGEVRSIYLRFCLRKFVKIVVLSGRVPSVPRNGDLKIHAITVWTI